MVAPHRHPGVPDDLTPDELEGWSNELVAFLTSDRVPSSFRAWAREQADQLDAFMASGTDVDAAPDLDPEDDDPAPQTRGAVAKQEPPRPSKGRRAGETQQERMYVLQVPEKAGKLVLGITFGVLVLFAVFGVRSLTSGGSNGGSLPTSSTAPAFDQARADQLQQTLQQDPNNKDALYELGEMYFEAQRYEDSISTLTKLVAVDPANKQALNDIGTANFNLGKPDQAKVWWQKTLAVDANDVQAHYNLGFLYANAQPVDLAAAVNEWDTVVRLDPTSQLGQTAKVHVEGLKAQLTATPGAGSAAVIPTASPASGSTAALPTATAVTP